MLVYLFSSSSNILYYRLLVGNGYGVISSGILIFVILIGLIIGVIPSEKQ